ncbi:alpha/beta-Hydrolases superfamily protein [Perilla frutescens var. hirtella]|nr:alpha/beta-Hydrolases superfamily protein [Perilla frutescens var. hirtella]
MNQQSRFSGLPSNVVTNNILRHLSADDLQSFIDAYPAATQSMVNSAVVGARINLDLHQRAIRDVLDLLMAQETVAQAAATVLVLHMGLMEEPRDELMNIAECSLTYKDIEERNTIDFKIMERERERYQILKYAGGKRVRSLEGMGDLLVQCSRCRCGGGGGSWKVGVFAAVGVHGFGASIAHWRRSEYGLPLVGRNRVNYSTSLIYTSLKFGASDKPAGFQYTIEVWAQLILDFLDEVVQRPTVLLGNSIGSLACVCFENLHQQDDESWHFVTFG